MATPTTVPDTAPTSALRGPDASSAPARKPAPSPLTHFAELGRPPVPWAELTGRDLQIALALGLFEWQQFPYMLIGPEQCRARYCPPGDIHISTVAEPSFTSEQVSEWMMAKGWVVDLEADGASHPSWSCSVWSGGNGDAAQVQGATMLEAIGRAALVAKAELARRGKKSRRSLAGGAL